MSKNNQFINLSISWYFLPLGFAVPKNKIMFKKLIIVPEKLNLEQFLIENPAEFDFNIDYGYAILHQILIETSYKIDEVKDWKNFKTYKRVFDYALRRSSSFMQLKFKPYDKHLNYFYAKNILWRQPYSEGVCRKYQLAPKYFAEKVRFVEITDRKIINIFFIEKEDNMSYYPLNKWLDSKLQIDTKSALESLNSTFEGDVDWGYYLTRCRAVLGIANTHYYFSRNEFTDDRFHSSFTSIPKDVRKYLSYNGNPLGEVDISASVPFFLYCQLLYLVDDGQRINLAFFDNFFKKNRLYSNALNITKSKVKLDKEEIMRFGETLLNGTFYQEIMTHFDDNYYEKHSVYVLNRAFDNSDEDRKVIAKKMILSSINSRNYQHKETKEFLKAIYPTIMQFLEVFKTRRYLNESVKKKLQKKLIICEEKLKEKFQQHKKVPHLLLQTESYFMLDVLVRKLNKRYSKMPFFTLHDCIVTTEENIEFLEEFMVETFIETIGFSANFKSQNFRIAS